MRYRVQYAPLAEAQLDSLVLYLSERSSEEIAFRFVDGIVDYCESLATFPVRGAARDDVRPGLRITSYRRRVAIAFAVEDDRVTILGVFYGGQDYEAALLDDSEEA